MSATSRKQATLGELVEAYRQGPAYRKLAPATKLNADKSFRKLGPILSRPLTEVSKGDVVSLMDTMPPGVAYVFMTRVRTMFQFGVEREWLAANPASGLKTPVTGEYRPWTDAEIDRFIKQANPTISLAIQLGLYTGQRMSDVVRMKWDDIQDGSIHIVQQKTGVELWVPVHPRLRRALDKAQRRGATILAQASGEPYSVEAFRGKFGLERNRLKFPGDLHFHGLRKSMAVKMAEGGATTMEIKAVGGWKTTKMVEHYCKGANQRQLATKAMGKMT